VSGQTRGGRGARGRASARREGDRLPQGSGGGSGILPGRDRRSLDVARRDDPCPGRGPADAALLLSEEGPCARALRTSCPDGGPPLAVVCQQRGHWSPGRRVGPDRPRRQDRSGGSTYDGAKSESHGEPQGGPEARCRSPQERSREGHHHHPAMKAPTTFWLRIFWSIVPIVTACLAATGGITVRGHRRGGAAE